jgi:thymidylate kinase
VSTEPRRVEIVGVAGTGKSTLMRALVERYPACHGADTLHTRLPGHWRYVVHSLPVVVPLFAKTVRFRSALSWDEVKYVVYVSEWSRYLDVRPEHHLGITVLDQGPLFGLARLLWERKPATRSPWFRAWVRQMVARWSTRLDLVVWLDAPDDVLVERIDEREQGHEAKGRATDDALELLARHRDAYDRVLDEVSRLGLPPVHRLETSTRPPADLAAELGGIFEDRKWLTDRGRVLNV